MSPRRYRMTRRRTAAEETRRRILEATVALHTEKGIFGTSWQDIAGRADVSVGTVYKHFPSLDALVPACGALLMERTRPPAPEDAERIVGGAAGARARLARVASELFAFYERAGASISLDARERELPAVKEWEAHLRGTIATLVRAALAPGTRDAAAVRVIGALFDAATFGAMRARGIRMADAAETAAAMAADWLEGSCRDTRRRSGARAARRKAKSKD